MVNSKRKQALEKRAVSRNKYHQLKECENKDKKQEILEDDAKLDGIKESLLKANMKLDQVCNVTNETRTDIKALNKDLADLDKEVVILKRDLKTAFSRIDELREMIKDGSDK